MSIFDTFFFNLFLYFKKKKSKNATKIATYYVSILQCSLLLLLGVFFAGFFNQMRVATMSSTKAWILFTLLAIGVFFKNWMLYTGKKRNLLNAKRLQKRKQTYNIWILLVLPFIMLGLAYILYHAI